MFVTDVSQSCCWFRPKRWSFEIIYGTTLSSTWPCFTGSCPPAIVFWVQMQTVELGLEIVFFPEVGIQDSFRIHMLPDVTMVLASVAEHIG